MHTRAPLPLLLVVVLAGCTPASFDSGVPRDLAFGDVSVEQARAICEAEHAFRQQHLPPRERIELDCTFGALGTGDVSECEASRAECIALTPVVDFDPCETVLPPAISCRATVGDYEECTSWVIRHGSRLHGLATCAILEDPSQQELLFEAMNESETAACARFRRDCRALGI